MTSGDARLASGARVQVDLEGVLLTWLGAIERNEVAVHSLAFGEASRFVQVGKALDRRHLLLLVEVPIEQWKPDDWCCGDHLHWIECDRLQIHGDRRGERPTPTALFFNAQGLSRPLILIRKQFA
jgi:hypothetical protein